MYKAYKYRIYPTKAQEQLLAQHFGATRWIYNYALNKNTDGTSEIQACGDRELSLSMKQEAPTPLGLG